VADGTEDEAVGGGLVETHADGGGPEYRAFFFFCCFCASNREGLREYRHDERRAPSPAALRSFVSSSSSSLLCLLPLNRKRQNQIISKFIRK